MEEMNSPAVDAGRSDDSRRDYPRISTFHTLVEQQSERTPQSVAVVFDNQSLTYRELDARANQLAHRLRAMGVKPNVLIALCVERSIDMIVGLLGVLKAGGAYVPLDPAYPSGRIAYMLEDSQAQIILTQGALVDLLPQHQAETLCLDLDWSSIATEPITTPPASASADDLAYVIYTSGSTGRPKGVEIPHRALVNFLCSMRDTPGLDANDRLLAVTTLSFDIAGLELYLPLTLGAQVIIASRDMAADGNQLAQQIEDRQVTVMQATPATWRLLLQAGWQGSSGLRVFCGGEALSRTLANRLIPLCAELWNLYGPTETTIWSTVHRVEPGSGPVSIGRPIANTEICVLDDNNRPVPAGTPGELFIGGDGLARGYFNRAELTTERFVPHPSDTTPGARLYRTGDLVKWLPDGSLEHLGRVDFQVKVRGFRIELGEIEVGLEQQEFVSQAVVLAREDVPGQKRLVAYVIPSKDQTPTSRELRKALAATLPDYMVPGFYVFLDAFPLTPNGKVDRKAMLAPGSDRPELAEDYLAPRTEEEARLANVWAEVLRIEEIGVNDNFFELGGDSLMVAQVATRIRDAFNINIHLRSMFENPTIAAFIPVLEAAGTSSDSLKELPISEVSRGEIIPLSFAQERVWFLHQFNPDNLAYNFQSTIDLRGSLDVDALKRTLREILRRHEAYRTTFPTVNGRPVQVIHPTAPFRLPLVDLSKKPEDEREAAAKAWSDEEFQLRFDLTQLPLVRWTLLRYSEHEHVLVHMEHHLVHDGWSFNMFLRELVALYRAFAAGEPSPLPELPIQFAEFASWQHQWMQGDVSDYQLAYWKRRFETQPPVLALPTKGPRPATQSFRGTSLRPEVPLNLCNDLRTLSRKESSTLFMTMLAGFIALLHRYTGESDIAVGTFFANRRARESESLIGMILNNVVIRAALETNPNARELIRQVRDLVLEGADYQDVPFDRVVDAVQPKRDMSMNPLFQVMFSFHDEPMPKHGMPGLDVSLTPVISNGSAKFDLGVIGIPHSAQQLGLRQGSEQDGLTMIWEHNTDLFDTAVISRMFEHYKSLLVGMVTDPDAHISDLPMLTDAEMHEMLVEWNATRADYPANACLHDLIQTQAAATPDAVAAVFEGQEVSYAALESRSNQLAHHLRGLGVGPDALVGICVERSVHMLVGLLGILKSGGAYVPIDPTFPADRQRFMLEDGDISTLVTERDLCDDLPADGIAVVRLDTDSDAIAKQTVAELEDVGVTPENLAYVIYTSGSTGRPKGVRLPHRAVVNFLNSMRKRPGLKSDDCLFAVTTLSFDIAGLEVFLPLTVGARVIISTYAVATNGEELAKQLDATGATIMQATPTTWQMLIDSGWTGSPSFTALCGGEALPRSLTEDLLTRVGALWNMYGPTETTIWSTIQKMESDDGPVPIGKPIDNTQVYLLDAYGNPVAMGVEGELCIGGAGVAHGYLNQPGLTREKFIDNPIPGISDSKIYRTGDRARYRPDGTLECLGRTDHQIKLRGFRIELDEIETLLNQQEGVRQAVVIVREDAPGDKRLVAYVVPAFDTQISPGDVATKLREKLPDYMVPTTSVILDAMPLTPNAKVDRSALPAPTGERQGDASTYIAPREEYEEKLKEIWEQLLGVSPLGVQDDFFDVGGHSLLAVRLVSEIEIKLGKRIPLSALLQGPTIENVARIMRGEDAADKGPEPPPKPWARLRRLLGGIRS